VFELAGDACQGGALRAGEGIEAAPHRRSVRLRCDGQGANRR
jgi:hypothetical protein